MSHDPENTSVTGAASAAHSTAADSPMRRTLRLLRQTGGGGGNVDGMGSAIEGLTAVHNLSYTPMMRRYKYMDKAHVLRHL